MSKYVPSYPIYKLDSLRRYVENFKKKLERKVASVMTETYRDMISKAPTDGDARYTFFNNLFFGGKLPKDVKVYLTDSKKNKSKSTGFDTKERRNNYISMQNDAKNPEDGTLGAWWEDSKSIYIYLDRAGYDDFAIDTILVHEMCHVYQDCVFTGKKSGFDHGSDFQYKKRKVQKDSKEIYDGGAFIDIDKKILDFNGGRYGDPTLGKDKKQIDEYYFKRINEGLKEFYPDLKLSNLSKREFKSGLDKFIFTGNYFSFSAISEISKKQKMKLKILNEDKKLISYLKDCFDRIKNKRGI